MSGLSDTNIVLGQGDSIRVIHGVNRQDLELNQQFTAQMAKEKKKEEKSKIGTSEKGDRVDIKADKEGRGNERREYDGQRPRKRDPKGGSDFSDERIVDIKV